MRSPTQGHKDLHVADTIMIDCIYKKILFVLASLKPNFDLLRESGECFRGVANLPVGNESTEDVYILQGTGIPSQF